MRWRQTKGASTRSEKIGRYDCPIFSANSSVSSSASCPVHTRQISVKLALGRLCRQPITFVSDIFRVRLILAEKVNTAIAANFRTMDAELILLASATVATALILAEANEEAEKKRRRIWTRDWIRRRGDLGHHHTLYKELRNDDIVEFGNYFRMMPCDFDHLRQLVSPLIEKADSHMRPSISVDERLDLTLRFLACGGTYSSLQYPYRIPKQTISKIIPTVCDALFTVLKEYVKVPDTAEQWEAIAKEFHAKWNMPHCIGALDGKHITLKAPVGEGSYYFNYKGTHSIILLALVDADYKFTYIDVGCNGRVSDGGVFARSTLYSALEKNTLGIPNARPLPSQSNPLQPVPFYVVGDSAFPLKSYLMKPYPERHIDVEKQIFNYRLCRARRIVENAFGILSNRFRVLSAPIQLSPSKTEKVVLACCALHNYMRSRPSRQVYSNVNLVDHEDENHVVTRGSWRGTITTNQMLPLKAQNGQNSATKNAKTVREALKNYLNNEGSVPWQRNCVDVRKIV